MSWRAIYILGMIFAVFLMFLTSLAKAHDYNRPELKKWFEGLYAKGFGDGHRGSSCCDGTDATRLDDVDWENDGGHYRVRIEGQWYDVPPEAVVEGPNLAGPAMVWPNNGIRGISVRCFMPGTMS